MSTKTKRISNFKCHKRGLVSQAFADIKAKEMQERGYTTKVVLEDGYFAVYVSNKKEIISKQNEPKSAFDKMKIAKLENQKNLQFIKDNNIELPKKLNKKGNLIIDRRKKTVLTAISKFKANQNLSY